MVGGLFHRHVSVAARWRSDWSGPFLAVDQMSSHFASPRSEASARLHPEVRNAQIMSGRFDLKLETLISREDDGFRSCNFCCELA